MIEPADWTHEFLKNLIFLYIIIINKNESNLIVKGQEQLRNDLTSSLQIGFVLTFI